MLQCGECHRILMDKTADGWKLRTRMVLFTPEGAKAICPSCKTAVTVPVSMDAEPVGVLPKGKLLINE